MPEPSSLPQQKVILECITGKDERRQIAVGDKPVKIGALSLEPDLAIIELDASQGYILGWLREGVLVLDASHCTVPLTINNRVVTTGALQPNDSARIGGSVWKARYANATFTEGIKGQFTQLIGLEELKDFKLGDIFSEVFKKHTPEEMEEQLITGTARHTPALSEIEIGWAKPWLFARLLVASVALAWVLYEGYDYFANDNLLPGLIIIGAFAVPFSTLIFFLEMNVPRNVSIFTVILLSFAGGVASLILALIFYSQFKFFTTLLGKPAAGIIEESAKILIVVLLIGKSTRPRWILNGMLFGAAVGTGFAAFESAGYVFRYMRDEGLQVGIDAMLQRGMLAPFGHIIWTASAAGALWLVKGSKPFDWDMLKAPAFLRVFIAVVVLHMIWDTHFSLLRLPLIIDLKFLILIVVGWVIGFRLIQTGLQQLNKARQEELGGGTTAEPAAAGMADVTPA